MSDEPRGPSAVPTLSSTPRSDAWTPPEIELLTWAVSPERDAYLDRRLRARIAGFGGLLIATASAILAATYLKTPGTRSDLQGYIASGVIAFVGLFLMSAPIVGYVSARSAFRNRASATAAARVDWAITMARKGDDGTNALPLPRLFELNRRQLDEYQVLTRRQQRSAVRVAQVAGVVAFAALLTGILIVLHNKDDSVTQYFTGGLTGLGTLLSSFVAAVFLKQARRADKQMNRYFEEPRLTGLMLAAERLAGELGDDGSGKDAARTIRTKIATSVLTRYRQDPAAKQEQSGSGDGKADGAAAPAAPPNP